MAKYFLEVVLGRFAVETGPDLSRTLNINFPKEDHLNDISSNVDSGQKGANLDQKGRNQISWNFHWVIS